MLDAAGHAREAVIALGEAVNADEPATRRRAAEKVIAAGNPVAEREDVWAAVLAQHGLNRHAALACFTTAASYVPGRWRPRDPAVSRHWEGVWAVIIHGHEAEHEPDRWLNRLIDEGAAAAASDIVAVVTGIRARIDRQLASGIWEPDPDDPVDGGQPISDDDAKALRDGAAELDRWLPTLR